MTSLVLALLLQQTALPRDAPAEPVIIVAHQPPPEMAVKALWTTDDLTVPMFLMPEAVGIDMATRERDANHRAELCESIPPWMWATAGVAVGLLVGGTVGMAIGAAVF